MNDPKAFMNEYHHIANALCDWFESQEIGPGRAVAVMSYLIGVLAAEQATDMNDAMAKLQMLQVATKLVCHGTMAAKGS